MSFCTAAVIIRLSLEYVVNNAKINISFATTMAHVLKQKFSNCCI